MTLRRWVQPVLCGLFAVLSACGSNNDSEHASIIDGSGAPVPDIAVSGSVTGFGSVFVDSVRFATEDAVFYVNGEEATEDALAIGDYVTLFVDSSVDGQKAQIVYLETAVAGEISSVNLVAGSFTILEQTIIVDTKTHFSADFTQNSLAALAVGDYVDVRGVLVSEGEIYATRIEPTTDGDTRLTGKVKSLNEGELSFTLNGVSVDYHTAALNEPLNNGDWVSVAGQWQDATLEVATVRKRKDQATQAGFTLTLSGKASHVNGNRFELAGREVILTEQTLFAEGSITDLSDGTKVTLTGEIQADGSVLVSIIAIKPMMAFGAGSISMFEFGNDGMPGAFPQGIWVDDQYDGIFRRLYYQIEDDTDIVFANGPNQGEPLEFADLRLYDFVFIEFSYPEPGVNQLTFAKAHVIKVSRMEPPPNRM